LKIDEAGHKTLKATDASGKIVFDGPIDSPDQREKLPPEVAGKLKELESISPPPTDPRRAGAELNWLQKPRGQRSIVWSNDQYDWKLSLAEDGKMTLRVQDKTGRILRDGVYTGEDAHLKA